MNEEIIRKEVYNGFVGYLPPCATILPREPYGCIIEHPRCDAFYVYKDTPHYYGLEPPYSIRKVFPPLIFGMAAPLPEKCHNCPLALAKKFKPCPHKDSKIFSSVSDTITYDFRCKDCGLWVSGLREEALKFVHLLQPIEKSRVFTQLKFFWKYKGYKEGVRK